MRSSKQTIHRVLALALAGSLAACGDDSASASTSVSGTDSATGVDTETGGVTLTTSVSADDTGRTDASATGDDSTDDTATDTTTGLDTTTGPDTDTMTDTGLDETGEPPVAPPGQTHSQLVSAGTQASSSSYSVVFTIGQPSKLQSTHDSTNYRLQGGLIGANGSPP